MKDLDSLYGFTAEDFASIKRHSKAPGKPEEPRPATPTDTTSEEGRKAIERAVKKFGEAGEGEKWQTLRKVAYTLGGYAGGGFLTKDDAINALDAAVDIRDDIADFKAAYKTTRQSVEAGIDEPITAEQIEAEKEEYARANGYTESGGFKTEPDIEDQQEASEADKETLGGLGGSEHKESKEKKWPDPQPIETPLLPVEQMHPEMIPEPIRPWLADIAYRMRCPLDYVVAAAVVMIGAIIGTACGIRPKRNDDWQITPNLWGGVVGNPSQLKTPSMNEVIKATSRLVVEAQEEYESKMREYQATLAVYKAQKEAITSAMTAAAKGKTKDGTTLETLKAALAQLEEPSQPTERRYQTSDSTVEKLGELLNENPRGLLVFRDELMGLLASWDKQGREADRAFYLEAWNGNGSHVSDRIGRGTTYVENCCLSLLGGIQPAKLIGYLTAAQGYENDGFVQRLQVLVYPDAPAWKLIDQYPDSQAKNRAFAVIKRLAEMDFSKCGATQGEDDKLPFIRFDTAAQVLFYKWLTDLENNKLRSGEPSPLMVEHLAKYRSLMPSLALIFHLIEVADGSLATAVSLSATEKAVQWCTYLESHARRIYGLVASPARNSAAQLAGRIKKGQVSDGFTAKKVYQNDWHLLNSPDAVKTAIEWLVDAQWLREVLAPKTTGRPAAPTYLINPKIPINT